MIIITNPSPPPATGPPLDQPISFSVNATFAVDGVGVSIRYLRDPLTYVIFETDVFAPRYAPVSSVANIGSASVDFTIFEFGGWRGDILAIEVFGIETPGIRFVKPVWDHRAG